MTRKQIRNNAIRFNAESCDNGLRLSYRVVAEYFDCDEYCSWDNESADFDSYNEACDFVSKSYYADNCFRVTVVSIVTDAEGAEVERREVYVDYPSEHNRIAS